MTSMINFGSIIWIPTCQNEAAGTFLYVKKYTKYLECLNKKKKKKHILKTLLVLIWLKLMERDIALFC